MVQAALRAPQIAGFVNWLRFPHWEKEALDDGGWKVVIRDLRYVNPGDSAMGIGMATVRLVANLQVIDAQIAN